ncbi:MAG: hypothetical protein U0Q11_20045 [Vicinamibacterales bacterium]
MNQAPAQPAAEDAPAARDRDRRSLRHDILLVLATGLLSLVGVGLGTFLTARYQASRWELETTHSEKLEVLRKRMELLERTVHVFSQIGIAESYSASGQFALAETQSSLLKHQPAQDSMEAASSNASRIVELQSELASALTLDLVYFGPKTTDAIASLRVALDQSSPWWKIDRAKTQAVLDAIAVELKYGL